ncbi:MAG: hypothetical protein V7731_07905 [Amphritea sp.]
MDGYAQSIPSSEVLCTAADRAMSTRPPISVGGTASCHWQTT